jgi:hypothetical protein
MPRLRQLCRRTSDQTHKDPQPDRACRRTDLTRKDLAAAGLSCMAGGAGSPHGRGLCCVGRHSAGWAWTAAWTVRTLPGVLGHGRRDVVLGVDVLLEAIGDLLLLLVGLKVLSILLLDVRLKTVVLAGGVEGRHGEHGADRRTATGTRTAVGGQGRIRTGRPLYIAPAPVRNRRHRRRHARLPVSEARTHQSTLCRHCLDLSPHTIMHDEPIPPPSFEDFTFAFDPALPNVFPSPPPLPSSADLFSSSETTDLFGFLDNFGAWDLEAEVQNAINLPSAPLPPPAPERHGGSTSPDSGLGHHPMTLQSALAMSMSDKHQDVTQARAAPRGKQQSTRTTRSSQRPPPTPTASASTSSSSQATVTPDAQNDDAKPKQLLSTPQKRLNHIMSEQKRRNAIRDGYVQLTTLLAPAGAPPGAGMPTRGRPKGSGARSSRGRGAGAFKGKSGILFRAVEYIQWLEVGRDALLEEVLKVEAAAGIHRPNP